MYLYMYTYVFTCINTDVCSHVCMYVKKLCHRYKHMRILCDNEGDLESKQEETVRLRQRGYPWPLGGYQRGLLRSVENYGGLGSKKNTIQHWSPWLRAEAAQKASWGHNEVKEGFLGICCEFRALGSQWNRLRFEYTKLTKPCFFG